MLNSQQIKKSVAEHKQSRGSSPFDWNFNGTIGTWHFYTTMHHSYQKLLLLSINY